MTKIGIHVFRKDLRICDNLALNQLANHVDEIIGVFIFDQLQIKRNNTNANHYSDKSAQFLIDCVEDLKQQCNGKLLVTYGNTMKVLESIIKEINPDAISFNDDFTPFALERDNHMARLCDKYKITVFRNQEDQFHKNPDLLVKSNGSPYMVFGPFKKLLLSSPVSSPTSKRIKWITSRKIDIISLKDKGWNPIQTIFKGGRTEAIKKMKMNITTSETDHLMNESSQLSAYLNYGCLSIRELHHHVLKTFGSKCKMLESLAWRDFYLCIFRFRDHGNEYRHIDERYDKLKFPKVNQIEWKRFVKCDTGFLLIDAIMTELLQTGYINNRARLLLATFWIKYLLINPFNPEYGSQTGFSRLLIDCAACQNKLNHQWVIGDLDYAGRRFCMKGTNSLSGRMIRIDNDMIKRYDPNYEYIAKWIPRFANLDLKERKKITKNIKTMYDWKERYLQYANLFEMK